MLFSLTQAVNYLALAVALWLGLYVVTRNPRHPIAWLTSLTLWSVGGLFLNMLLALNPPPIPASSPGWLRLFLPFWSAEAFESGWPGWLQGWQVTPAVVLWHHVTVLMRPGRMNWWRWARVLLGYVIAVAAILIQIYTPFMFTEVSGDPLHLNTIKGGSLYALSLLMLGLFTVMSFTNLLQTARVAPSAMHRQQIFILAVATLVAGLTVPVAFTASVFEIPIPRVILSLLLGIAVVLIGYGVARYSALMEGRTMWRDFIYNAVAMGLVTALYLFGTWISTQVYDVPAAAFVLVVMLAIVTHTLVDVGRRSLDVIFYRMENRQLREIFRRLAGLVSDQDSGENLNLALESISSSVRATYSLILLFKENRLEQAATYHWHGGKVSLSPTDLTSDDVLHLEPGQLPSQLTEAALLIPLYGDREQLGALILGRPENGINYSQADVEQLIYPSDLLSEAIWDAQREAEYLSQIAQLPRAQQSEVIPEPVPFKVVDDALRNLFNYAHLGDTPLADLELVNIRLPEGPVTHVDRGKAVYSVVSEALEKLRPEVRPPGEPAAREWHPYLILHDAYIEDRLNREIMARLYISEGTFNRTRRSAIRSVARVLGEMEAALH